MKLCTYSTYLMILRLIQLEPFCKDHQLINTDIFLSTQNWDRIDNFLIKATIMNSYY